MRAQGIPPNWMPYVETNDVDETARVASSLGGSIVSGPMDIPGTGRIAVVRDPQGATFGIYKPNGVSPAWDGTPVVGRFSWHELMTTDWKAAFEFYHTLFGWEKQSEMDMGGGSMYAMFGKNQMYGGMFNRTPEMASMRPFWLCYVYVKDVGKAVDIATKAGAFVQRPRMEIPGGTIAILGDPQGAGFALHDSMAGAATPKPPAKAAMKKAAKKPAEKSDRKDGLSHQGQASGKEGRRCKAGEDREENGQEEGREETPGQKDCEARATLGRAIADAPPALASGGALDRDPLSRRRAAD